MRRVLVILLISLAYAGCQRTGEVGLTPSAPLEAPSPDDEDEAEPLPEPVAEPQPTVPDPPSEPVVPPIAETPRYGGIARIWLPTPKLHQAVIRANIAGRAVAGGLLDAVLPPEPPHRPCWKLIIASAAAYPDGTPVRAAEVVAEWEKALIDPVNAAHWLLEVVRGADDVREGHERHASGLAARDGEIDVCTERTAPDLPTRIGHPALAHWRAVERASRREGPGPYAESPDGILVPNPRHVAGGPFLERVEPAGSEGNPAVLFRVGDLHAAVGYGAAARELATGPGAVWTASPLPAWDRTYYLWLQPGRRWVNDPEFRQWLAGIADRDEIVDFLFDGVGERAFSLRPGLRSDPAYEVRPDRPLLEATAPRLKLHYDDADPYATQLARRLVAVLELHDVALSLEPRAIDRLLEEMARGEVDVALLARHPAVSDPLLALLGEVWWFGAAAGEERAELLEASRLAEPQARAAAADEIELKLLGDARVVPLLRLDAWFARHVQLTGVDIGAEGELRLATAWWMP